jgi:hypothetical protein
VQTTKNHTSTKLVSRQIRKETKKTILTELAELAGDTLADLAGGAFILGGEFEISKEYVNRE